MRSFGVLSIALAVTLLLAPAARGQSAPAANASIKIGGQVSEAIFVSIAPGAQLAGETPPFTYSNLDKHTVRLSIPAPGNGGSRQISIPLQIRSNVSYTLSASANLSGATATPLLLRELCVAGVKATGRYVAAGAVNAAGTTACADATTGTIQTRGAKRNLTGVASPATLLRGDSISLSGTSDSPFNALEVLLRVEVEPQPGQTQGRIELTVSAAPGNGVSAATTAASRR